MDRNTRREIPIDKERVFLVEVFVVMILLLSLR
jgi:hypothetical protein